MGAHVHSFHTYNKNFRSFYELPVITFIQYTRYLIVYYYKVLFNCVLFPKKNHLF